MAFVVGCRGTVILPGIQLRLDGELCSIHPADLLLDLVPEYSKVCTIVTHNTYSVLFDVSQNCVSP